MTRDEADDALAQAALVQLARWGHSATGPLRLRWHRGDHYVSYKPHGGGRFSCPLAPNIDAPTIAQFIFAIERLRPWQTPDGRLDLASVEDLREGITPR